MTANGELLHHETVFDDWRTVAVAIYMALAGYGVMVGMPVISTAWVEQLGFTDVQVGRLSGADLGGLAIGAVLASFVMARVNRRYMMLLSAAIAVAANALCTVFTSYEPTLVLRLVAGFGAGMFTAVSYATLGASSHPARNFNILLFAFAFTQAAEVYAFARISIYAIYFVFIGSYPLALLFMRHIPPHPVDAALDVEVERELPGGEHAVRHVAVPAWVPWLVLAAIGFTYLNIGAYWTYIELSTVGTSADPEWVEDLLVFTSLFSLFGCLFATLISNRFGLARPLLVTLVFQSIIVGMLAAGITNTTIMISMFAFNFCWIFIDVYQAATVANVDHSGRYMALIPGAQGFGLLIGPNLAASVLAAGLGYPGVFIMCAAATMIAMLVYLYMYLMLRRRIPALADAS